MGTKTIEGIAYCVRDQEEDYLGFLPEDRPVSESVSISSLVLEAGGTAIRGGIPESFEYGGTDDPDADDPSGYWATTLAGYREETGRKNLPLARVKVTVTVEPLTEEESGKVWSEYLHRVRELRDREDRGDRDDD